ncbi:hypothetical protein ACRRTK_018902 [Alexandromys fortis]
MGAKALLCCHALPMTRAGLITWLIALRGQPPYRIFSKVETKETNETNCTDRKITWAFKPDQYPDFLIDAVALNPDGLYSFDITTLKGNFQEKHDLQVPPAVTLLPGENRTTVCEAIAGKPAAQIFWSPDGNHITKQESHSNGTVTVRSTYHWEQNNVSAVFCFVFHPTGNQTLSIELNQVTGVTITPHSLLTILYVKLSLLGIILLIVGSAFFQKRNYFRAETKEINETNCTDKRITWASTPDQSSDLLINAVALDHDGLYSCDILTPQGNFQESHDLHVLVPPAVTLLPGENRRAVCEAIAGKPAAQIFWTPDGNHVTKQESHSNGTVTVRSTYYWEQNNVSAVFCFVSHPTGNLTLPIELNQVTGVSSTLHSLLTILYVKLALLGIILLILGFVFFLKRNYFRVENNETHKGCADERITWASTPDQSPDLQINAVALGHDGHYSCQIHTLMKNFQQEYSFHVIVPPEVTLVQGKNRTAVCEAIAGKPIAQIFWTPDGDCKTVTASHSNGTATVRSTCHWEHNNVSDVFCFVSYLTGSKLMSIELNQESENPDI